MSSVNNSQRAKTGVELIATMTGDWVLIGILPYNAVHIIFDNFGDDSIAISTDEGATTWKTFPGGEGLVLDMRANHGIAANFTFDEGIAFYGNGASGDFSISYTYALET